MERTNITNYRSFLSLYPSYLLVDFQPLSHNSSLYVVYMFHGVPDLQNVLLCFYAHCEVKYIKIYPNFVNNYIIS